jgi:circadian clock protein KaiB
MTPTFSFRLYVLTQSAISKRAEKNLRAICDSHLEGDYQIEVIDLIDNIQLAEDQKIFATPTVERLRPEPVIRVIGDQSDTEAALTNLGIV